MECFYFSIFPLTLYNSKVWVSVIGGGNLHTMARIQDEAK